MNWAPLEGEGSSTMSAGIRGRGGSGISGEVASKWWCGLDKRRRRKKHPTWRHCGGQGP